MNGKTPAPPQRSAAVVCRAPTAERGHDKRAPVLSATCDCRTVPRCARLIVFLVPLKPVVDNACSRNRTGLVGTAAPWAPTMGRACALTRREPYGRRRSLLTARHRSGALARAAYPAPRECPHRKASERHSQGGFVLLRVPHREAPPPRRYLHALRRGPGAPPCAAAISVQAARHKGASVSARTVSCCVTGGAASGAAAAV